MESQVIVYCPDCCGKFEIERSDIVEGEIIECSLCMADILVLREEPKIEITLYNEDMIF